MDFCAFLDGHKLTQAYIQRNQRDDVAVSFREFAAGTGNKAAHQKFVFGYRPFCCLARRNGGFNLNPNNMGAGKGHKINAMDTSNNHLPTVCPP